MNRLTPEGQAHLTKIRMARAERQRRMQAVEEARAEITALILEGFELGVGQQKMAQAAGLSIGRLSQLKA